ncbi:MAG: hypothetical protein H6974_13035 [Gammaproteobacteria bacterium]|nr:hypothetical protein [Gammaproteobacteria bacterium]MCP5197689.1 hypothetical protein [Gammaproteobacteria bacterium]
MKQKSAVRSSTVTTKTKEARKAQEALAAQRRHNAALKAIDALDAQREREQILVERQPHPPVSCLRPLLISGESEQAARSAQLIAAALSSLFVGGCILLAAFLASGGSHS